MSKQNSSTYLKIISPAAFETQKLGAYLCVFPPKQFSKLMTIIILISSELPLSFFAFVKRNCNSSRGNLFKPKINTQKENVWTGSSKMAQREIILIAILRMTHPIKVDTSFSTLRCFNFQLLGEVEKSSRQWWPLIWMFSIAANPLFIRVAIHHKRQDKVTHQTDGFWRSCCQSDLQHGLIDMFENYWIANFQGRDFQSEI